jgi:hypothetical protein
MLAFVGTYRLSSHARLEAFVTQTKLNMHCFLMLVMYRVGQNHIYIYIHIFIQCIYGIFGREITKYTVIYGVYIYNCTVLAILCQVLSYT